MKKGSRPPGEVSRLLSPEKRKQIAKWIRDGLDTPNIHEDQSSFFDRCTDSFCYVCALGAAIVGKHGGDLEKIEKLINRACDRAYDRSDRFSYITFSTRHLQIPRAVAETINHLHLFSGKRVKRIATMLEEGTL